MNSFTFIFQQMIFSNPFHLLIIVKFQYIYSITSPIRHTCSVHILSKILIRMYPINFQTHVSSESKSMKYTKIKSYQ